jgi:hypothetical protein
MERFAPVLRRVDRELEVRDPERSRILLELAGDLEELYRAYRSRGCSEEEARRRAEAWLAPDEASLGGLRRLHTPLAGRLLESLSDVARSRLETAAFTALALGAVAAGLGGLRDTVFLWPPRPAAAAVLAIGGAGLALAARRAVRLLVSSGALATEATDLRSLPVLAAGSIVAGALGAGLELSSALDAAAGSGSGTPGTAPAAEVAAPGALWDAVAAAAGTAVLGVIVALVLGLAWFWLAARVRLVRGARAELREIAPYLENETEPSSYGRSR